MQYQQLISDIETEISTGKRKRIFSPADHIKLHPDTIKEVVRKLEDTFLFGIDVDLNGRLFETFLSSTMRGKDLGQFFTPIAFNGDYVWPDQSLANGFRPLRNPHVEFLDAA